VLYFLRIFLRNISSEYILGIFRGNMRIYNVIGDEKFSCKNFFEFIILCLILREAFSGSAVLGII